MDFVKSKLTLSNASRELEMRESEMYLLLGKDYKEKS